MISDKQSSSQSHHTTAGPSTVTCSTFTQHLNRASTIVQTWPEWKQQLLGRTAAQASASLRESYSCSHNG